MPIFNFFGLISNEISVWKQSTFCSHLKSGKNARFWPKGPWYSRAELCLAIHEFNGAADLICDWPRPVGLFAYTVAVCKFKH